MHVLETGVDEATVHHGMDANSISKHSSEMMLSMPYNVINCDMSEQQVGARNDRRVYHFGIVICHEVAALADVAPLSLACWNG